MAGKLTLTLAVLVALAAAAAWMQDQAARERDGRAPVYRSAEVTRGPIASTVTAIGTLRAVVTVEVGTQVSGQVKTVHADFNGEVAAGDVIARIDPAPFEALLREAEADHAMAGANVSVQLASLEALQAELAGLRAAETEARGELARQQSLRATSAASASAVAEAVAASEQARAAVQAAIARIAQQQAQIELARAQVLKAAAAVQQRELDLEYTFIRSPVDGVVINRSVDAGQTVAASLQAPVLFRIAEDLRHMEVNVSVDEADIGRIREGQPVIFTVDAFLNRSFQGRVRQIRKAGEQISNVVTYTVVVDTANADGSLLPGMTANVTIVVARREDAMQVSVAALRLQLPQAPVDGTGESWVWRLQPGGGPQRIPVVAGITDGRSVEVRSDELRPGQYVVTGVVAGVAPPRP